MAGDMKDYFDDMKLLKKERKNRRLSEFNPDGWTRHNEYHYSKTINSERVDYWPSTNKCKYRGNIIFPASAYISRLEKCN
jgi:hypothetical protein